MLPVMTTLVDVTWPGRPVPHPRPRVTARGTFMPTRYAEAVEDLRFLLLADLRSRRLKQRYGGPVRVDVTFAVDRRADIDNLAKTVLDALTGVVLIDDQQVVDLHARLIPADGMPGSVIRVDTVAG